MQKHIEILSERFGRDSIMALATVDENGRPWVRGVNAIFHENSFYVVTYALSNKMKHIGKNPVVAISGEWFSGHAKAENLGHIKLEKNKDLAQVLRTAFSDWYDNGHVNEDDVNTVILKITPTDGTIFKNGERIDF